MAKRISTTSKANGVTHCQHGAKSRMDRLQLGIQAGYWLGNGMQPYAGLSYLGDQSQLHAGRGQIRLARAPGSGRSV
jgi:hypothetical protein